MLEPVAILNHFDAFHSSVYNPWSQVVWYANGVHYDFISSMARLDITTHSLHMNYLPSLTASTIETHFDL